MTTFLSITLFLYISQFFVATIFIISKDEDYIGIKTKLGAILFLILPYYFVYIIGKFLYNSIKELN